MSYQVVLTRSAKKELLRLPDPAYEAVTAALKDLQETPRPHGVTKLHGRPEYRVRVGEYRIIYAIDDPGRLVTVFVIAHRREAYR